MVNVSTQRSDTASLHTADWSKIDLPLDWRDHMGARGLLINLIHGMWCAVCIEKMVWLRRRHVWLAEMGVSILAIAVEDPTQVDAFNHSLTQPLPFALIPDDHCALSIALGLYDSDQKSSRPALLLLDHEGRVRFHQLDAHVMPEQSVLLEAIEQLPAIM